ncbi:MAG TPA: DUF4231 domain-containing protein [Pyrinomonadaceae bacterium]
MTKEQFDEYLGTRYQDQINWYDAKAIKSKSFYNAFQWGVIILSALAPILVITLEEKPWKWVAVAVTVLLAIGTAGLKAFKYQENWINYRSVAGALKKEKYLYDAGVDDYSTQSDKEATFVKRVEALISLENSIWVSTHRPEPEQQGKKTD